MADLVRWYPFQDAMSLRDAMNQLFAESFVQPRTGTGAFQPALDLYEMENEFVLKVAAPGLKADNFEITAQQNTLTIHGRTEDETKQDENKNGGRYHIQEQRFGEFSRTIQFPTPIDSEKIQATLANGILTVRVPKAESAKPRRISVQAQG